MKIQRAQMIHFIDSLKSVSPIFSVIIRCIDRMHICMQMISRSINNKCAPNQSTRNAISFAPSCRYLRQLKHINTHIYPCHVVCSSVRTNILISFDWIDSQKMKQKKKQRYNQIKWEHSNGLFSSISIFYHHHHNDKSITY